MLWFIVYLYWFGIGPFRIGSWGVMALPWFSVDLKEPHVTLRPRRSYARPGTESAVVIPRPGVGVPCIAAAWASELLQRSRELADGTVERIPWETARAQILAELKQRRGG